MMEQKVKLITASTYYRYRYIDTGCKCNCPWVCCPSCWFHIRWSGYRTWWSNRWVFGSTSTARWLEWKVLPEDGDLIWNLIASEWVEIDINLADNNRTRMRSRLLLNDHDSYSNLENVEKPSIKEVRELLSVGQFDTKDVKVKIFSDSENNRLEMKTEVLFYDEATAEFANNRFQSQEYRDSMKLLLSEKSGETLQLSLESSIIEPQVLEPTPKPTMTPTNQPTFVPTATPTCAPSNSPTHVPTAAPTWIGPCMNDPCVCEDNPQLGYVNEDPYCQICNMPTGCSQCQNTGEYFKLDYNYPCTQCQQVFGD